MELNEVKSDKKEVPHQKKKRTYTVSTFINTAATMATNARHTSEEEKKEEIFLNSK